MGGHIPGVRLPVSHVVSSWIQFALATPVVLWAGWPFFQRGWASMRNRHLNMFTLIALGVGVAWTYSVVATARARRRFRRAFRGREGTPPVYFEAAAVITVLVLIGQVLELRARERTGGAIQALLDLAPKTARRVRDDGADEDVALDRSKVGDRLRVRPGEKVPVDGEVLEGTSVVESRMVTGEPMPVAKEAGREGRRRHASTGPARFVMRAEKVGADTLLAASSRMVAEAQRSRAPIQRLADRSRPGSCRRSSLAALIAFAAWAIWSAPSRASPTRWSRRCRC